MMKNLTIRWCGWKKVEKLPTHDTMMKKLKFNFLHQFCKYICNIIVHANLYNFDSAIPNLCGF